MMSLSHCFRNWSLSKAGSTRRISVSTSDISVLENRPPTGTRAWGESGPGFPPHRLPGCVGPLLQHSTHPAGQ